MIRPLPWLLVALVLLPAAATARLPGQAPALPPPDPTTTTVIQVSTAQALADACWDLQSDQIIVVAAGTYDLSTVNFPNGVDGRLTVGRYGATPIANVQLRGATGDPQDVVLRGAGPLDPIVPFGVQIFTATEVLIADLTIERVYFHAIQIAGEQGAARVRVYHTRLADAGQQIVKGTGDADDVIIEYSEVFHSSGADHHPEGPGGGCYTNGIDSTGGARWILRDNLIHGIYCQDDTLAGPAILLWQGMSDSVVERNTILASSRGISLGLGAGDHVGGIVRNNFIRMDPRATYARDVGIYTVSPDSIIAHNTVLLEGSYPSAIEVRFDTTTGVRVENNFLDAAIQDRAGAVSSRRGNLSTATAPDFVDTTVGDLHLAPGAAAVDQGDPVPEVDDDFDAESRPSTTRALDLGADEQACSGCADGGSPDAGANDGGGDDGSVSDGGEGGRPDGGDPEDGGGVDAGATGDEGTGCGCSAVSAASSTATAVGGLLLLALGRRRRSGARWYAPRGPNG